MSKSNGNGESRQPSRNRNARYKVLYLPIDEVKPSPENEEIYGPIEHDQQTEDLIDSIERRGLSDPLLLTRDRFIISGHRRLYALRYLKYKEVPVWITKDKHDGNPEFHRLLAEYNPQRVKTPGSILREALLRDNNSADTYAAIRERREASLKVNAEFMVVKGDKDITPISDRRIPFLEAVQKVIEDLRPYWPLSIRQIHYRLLNDPPLRQTCQRSKYGPEHWRYKNDCDSYTSLVDLLTPARYLGYVPMTCIDDPTRPQKMWHGFASVSQFIQQDVDRFLTGYHRDRQQDQPRYIEVFAEKSTLFKIVSRACNQYYVPFSIGRGFCSVPVWRDIEKRFHQSGKERMTLIVVADYDPAGLNLADDAVRSLRDRHNIPVDGHRIAVNPEQIEELGLAEDFNPAKDGNKGLYNAFVERTGSNRTWEVEALPPDYLVDQIQAAIVANMDIGIYTAICEQEESDCDQLTHIRAEIADQLQL